jgi:hypothetical protein
MKLLVLPFGDAACASTHYRVLQYLDMLKKDGIDCEVLAPGEMPAPAVIAESDTVLVQKKLFPAHQVRTLRKHAKRLLFDIDDATWHPHGRKHSWWTRWRTNRRLQSIVRAADVSLVANLYIAGHLNALGGKTQVLPMALKAEDWPRSESTQAVRIRLGWSGAPVNLCYLEALEPVLAQVMGKHPEVELAVFCGKQPAFSTSLPYLHLPWRQGGEPDAVKTFHIGLLPLPTDAFSQGKSPIKALQYMAAGIPTIATPQAGSVEIGQGADCMFFAENPQQWSERLCQLTQDNELRGKMGTNARAAFEERFSSTQTYSRWKSFLLGK